MLIKKMLPKIIFKELPDILFLKRLKKSNACKGVDGCLKDQNVYTIYKITHYREKERGFYTKRLLVQQRIGPHNEEFISILVGFLLGDGWAEKRINATRFHIDIRSPNIEYIDWLHQFFAIKGYCSNKKVIPKKQIGKNGQFSFFYKLRTWSFSSLNWVYNLFYKNKNKRIPKNISELLTAKAFAIWLMDGGKISGKGIKISTEGFILQDIVILKTAIKERYSLLSTIQRHKKKWIIYFPLDQLPFLLKIVKINMIFSMYFKLNSN